MVWDLFLMTQCNGQGLRSTKQDDEVVGRPEHLFVKHFIPHFVSYA